jgi:hypothetical protein
MLLDNDENVRDGGQMAIKTNDTAGIYFPFVCIALT